MAVVPLDGHRERRSLLRLQALVGGGGGPCAGTTEPDPHQPDMRARIEIADLDHEPVSFSAIRDNTPGVRGLHNGAVTSPTPTTPEALLAHASWMRALAMGTVHQDILIEDPNVRGPGPAFATLRPDRHRRRRPALPEPDLRLLRLIILISGPRPDRLDPRLPLARSQLVLR